MKTFQVCYEGDLTLELASAIRRLKGEPNFDASWQLQLDDHRSSRVLARYLGRTVASNGHLIISEVNPSRQREYLLIRHSVTPGHDYEPLRREIGRLGFVLDSPASSTFIVKTSDRTQAHVLGDRLEEFCPWDSLMVTGLSRDFTMWSCGVSASPALPVPSLSARGRVYARA